VTERKASVFNRLVLPGFAFKAAVIGGGYATGRELATFFIPSGPVGGLYAIFLAMLIWSVVCSVTFLFAFQTGSRDYRAFFKHLLGPFWPLYEIAFLLALVVILAVFAAAAGAIGATLFGWPAIVGSLALMIAIALFAAWGNEAVEQLFKYVSYFLYGTYAIFVVLVLSKFGGQMMANFALDVPTTGWAVGGITYASYNIIGAIVILSVTRHLTSRRDAIIAGLLAGPMAMIPGLLFFLCMVAFYPYIGEQELPSDFLLEKLNMPIFRVIFQLMIFAALLESGTGGVHAINERIATSFEKAKKKPIPKSLRFSITIAILTGSVFIAGRFGLVDLIANGYRWLAYAFLIIYVLPIMTYGIWQLKYPKPLSTSE
jgi:uncharacterized membrane protein YkvI